MACARCEAHPARDPRARAVRAVPEKAHPSHTARGERGRGPTREPRDRRGGMTESEDPLGSLVARSVGGDVQGVRSEELDSADGIERKRLHFTRDGRETTALFERSARGVLLEAQLLPFLARKSERVPRVHSRGIPPPHVSLGPWLLLEDLSDAPDACEGDVAEIVRAKIAVERAVAADGPALRALGVPVRTPPDVVREAGGDPNAVDAARELSAWPVSLVHGDLRCIHAR